MLREELILNALDREIVGRELAQDVVLQATMLPGFAFRMEGFQLQQLSQKLSEQLNRAHQLMSYEKIEAIQGALSVDRGGLEKIYKALLDADVLKQLT